MFDRIKRRSIIFILGDFFEAFDFTLLCKKHEVIALVVRDHFEENPVPMGALNLIDPMSQKSAFLEIDDKTATDYSKKVLQKDHLLYKDFRKNQIAFTKIYTDEEPFVKLSKLFVRR